MEIKTNSSAIKAAHYFAETETLRISFPRGTYEYHGVPEIVAQQFSRAESQGKFYHAVIKGEFAETKTGE